MKYFKADVVILVRGMRNINRAFTSILYFFYLPLIEEYFLMEEDKSECY